MSPAQLLIPLGDSPWQQIRDADPSARALFDRHYSRSKYADGRMPAKFIGPGEYILLALPDFSALFAWRKFINPRDVGVNC